MKKRYALLFSLWLRLNNESAPKKSWFDETYALVTVTTGDTEQAEKYAHIATELSETDESFNSKWSTLRSNGMINDSNINQWWCPNCGENRGEHQNEGYSEAGYSHPSIKDNSIPIITDCQNCGKEFGYYFNSNYEYSPMSE